MKYNWKLILLLAVFGFVLLFQLGSGNVTIMEARNFVTAREMWTDGHILIPTLNEDYRLEKPPLPTWITALSGSLVDHNMLFWLRLPAVLLALITLYYADKIYRLFDPRQNQIAPVTLILCSSVYFFLMARSGMWDIYAQCFALIGIYYYVVFTRSDHPRLLEGSFFALFMSFSFMSKGPVALYGLVLPFLLAHHLFGSEGVKWNRSKRQKLIGAVILFAVLSASWPLYIYFSEAGRAATRVVVEESANWTGYNVRPFYYYWSFPVQSGVWTVFGFIGLLFCVRYVKRLRDYPNLNRYFWWTIFVVLLLSLVPEKKSRYLLPVLFPMAMFISQWASVKGWARSENIVRISGLLTALVFFCTGGLLLANPFPLTDLFNYRIHVSIILFCLGAYTAIAFYQKRNTPGVWGIGVTMLAIIPFIVSDIAHSIDAPNPVRSFTVFSEDEEYRNIPLYAIGEIRPELVWHMGRSAPEIRNCTIPDTSEIVGVFSYFESDTICPSLWHDWEIISRERFDQNPKESLKKPNPALRRYFWTIRRMN